MPGLAGRMPLFAGGCHALLDDLHHVAVGHLDDLANGAGEGVCVAGAVGLYHVALHAQQRRAAHLGVVHELLHPAEGRLGDETGDLAPQVTEQLLLDEMPVVPLFVYKEAVLVSDDLSNIEWTYFGAPVLNDAKLKNWKDYIEKVYDEDEDEDED